MKTQPLRRILLVDHVPTTRRLMTFVLGELDGYEVECCGSGPDAVDYAGRFKPDLVLLDVGMPPPDGPHTLELLRGAGIDAPVVFFTSRVGAANLERYRALGAMGTIAKPFDPLKVGPRLEQMWRRRQETTPA